MQIHYQRRKREVINGNNIKLTFYFINNPYSFTGFKEKLGRITKTISRITYTNRYDTEENKKD